MSGLHTARTDEMARASRSDCVAIPMVALRACVSSHSVEKQGAREQCVGECAAALALSSGTDRRTESREWQIVGGIQAKDGRVPPMPASTGGTLWTWRWASVAAQAVLAESAEAADEAKCM